MPAVLPLASSTSFASLMVRAAIAFLFAVVLCSDAFAGQRMSEAEGERYLWGGQKINPPRISLDQDEVVALQPESTHVSLSPEALLRKPGPKFLAKTTINVITRGVLPEKEIDAIAGEVREQASFFHVVGVRFRQEGDAEGQYGWLLYWDGRDTIRFIQAGKEQMDAAAGAVSASLSPGEKVIGTWADANDFPGTMTLTVRDGLLWLSTHFTDGSGGDGRTRLRKSKNGVLVGDYSISEIGTFKADGSGTDRVSAKLVGDELHVSDNSTGNDPWFKGAPVGAIDLSLLPTSELTTGGSGFAARDFTSLADVVACIEGSNASRAVKATDAQKAYRGCVSRRDVERLGKLAEIGAVAQVSCGASRDEPFELTKAASTAIWAALVADEAAHIKARLENEVESVTRGGPKAGPLCADLLARFGPEGTEVHGFIEPN
jgi:hypothetical protein